MNPYSPPNAVSAVDPKSLKLRWWGFGFGCGCLPWVLIMMFLAVWQFLSPTEHRGPSARGAHPATAPSAATSAATPASP